MDVTVNCIDQGTHVVVIVTGHWTKETSKYTLDTARSEAIKSGVTCILLDLCKLSLPDSEMTRFYAGEYIAKHLPFPYRVAAFGRPELINHFAETVTVNRGGHMKVFVDEESALQWLTEG